MAALVEFSEDRIIGLTLDGLVTDWNNAAERLYGYSSEEMLGASVAVLVPPELNAAIRCNASSSPDESWRGAGPPNERSSLARAPKRRPIGSS
jgi:PAS domain S-box-containing protein